MIDNITGLELPIQNRIHVLRGTRVMLDFDLAEVYGIETRAFNQSIKRNIERFPERFMFQLSSEEWRNLKSQFVMSSGHGGRRTDPKAFTEQGVAMLSAVLRSTTAIAVSIRIMDAFVDMRKVLQSHSELDKRMGKIAEQQLTFQSETKDQIRQLFQAIESHEVQADHGVFFDGQIFDAHNFVCKLLRSAQNSIRLIDNYIDDTVPCPLTLTTQDLIPSIVKSRK
jgi:hypothetical protein